MRYWVTALLVLAISCDDSRGKKGLPPADKWQAPSASGAEVKRDRSPWRGSEQAGDPHAGLDMGGGDPHAGLDMGGGDPHAGLGTDPSMNLQPPDPDRPIDESKYVAGKVVVDPRVGEVTPPVILFLSVRPINRATGDIIGSPLAVERLDVEEFPVTFRLTEAQSMVANTVFEGPVEVYARVDGDGEARTVKPGDIEGAVRAEIPAKGLNLKLTTRLR